MKVMIIAISLYVSGLSLALSGPSTVHLEVWNDPAFQRQFAESYKAETEIEPSLTSEEREAMQEVLGFISAEETEKARKYLSKIIGTGDVSAVFDFTLANIYFQAEELDKAVTNYKHAVEKHPKFRRAWKNLGVIHVRKGDFSEAIEPLTRVIELGGNDSVTYGLLGYSYSSVELFLPAESAYRMAILLDPATLDWQMGLVRSFFKQERFAEAAALCGQLIESHPERHDLWLLQANAYIGLGRPMDAAEIYEIVDHMGASSVDSLNMLGDIYINEEMYNLAVDSYIRALKKDDDHKSERPIRAAKVLAARGALTETNELISEIETVIGDKIEPADRKDILKLRARLAVAEGASEDEVRILKEIIELDPLDGEALILLGQDSARNDDSEQAIFYFERAANIEGFEAEASVRHAQTLVRLSKYTEAIPLLRRAQQVDPRENIQEYLEQVERIAKTRK